MKKTMTMTMGAVAVVLMAAVSCTETETGIEPQPGNDGGQVSLGVAANLKVDAGTRASTKSVVSGDAITYPKDKFSVEAPGLGVLVTNSSVNGWYTPDGGANCTISGIWVTRRGLAGDRSNRKAVRMF